MGKRKYELIDGNLVLVSGVEDTKGDARRMREILESHTTPGLSTDSTFFAGIGSLNQQIADPRSRERLHKNAKRMGIPLTGNEFYQPGLAKFPGDPRACIPHSGGKEQIRKMIEEKGTGSEGAITVKKRQRPPQPKCKLHPSIVARHMQRMLKEPGNALRDRKEMVAEIIEKHGPQKQE